jgi:uncharacterized membrane protein
VRFLNNELSLLIFLVFIASVNLNQPEFYIFPAHNCIALNAADVANNMYSCEQPFLGRYTTFGIYSTISEELHMVKEEGFSCLSLECL